MGNAEVFALMRAGHVASEVQDMLGLTNAQVWRAYESECKKHYGRMTTVYEHDLGHENAGAGQGPVHGFHSAWQAGDGTYRENR